MAVSNARICPSHPQAGTRRPARNASRQTIVKTSFDCTCFADDVGFNPRALTNRVTPKSNTFFNTSVPVVAGRFLDNDKGRADDDAPPRFLPFAPRDETAFRQDKPAECRDADAE